MALSRIDPATTPDQATIGQPTTGIATGGVVVGRPVGQIGQGVGSDYGPGYGGNIDGSQGFQYSGSQGNYGRSGSRNLNAPVMVQMRSSRLGGGTGQTMMIVSDSRGLDGSRGNGGSPYGASNVVYMIDTSGQDPRVGRNNLFVAEDVSPPTLFAAVTCILCMCPGGICACISFLKCQECADAVRRRDFKEARQKREEAMRWIYGAWITGLLFMILYAARNNREGEESNQEQR